MRGRWGGRGRERGEEREIGVGGREEDRRDEGESMSEGMMKCDGSGM